MKRNIALLLTISIILSLLVFPVSAAEKPEVSLSVVSFTENKKFGAIEETTAPEQYKAGDTLALKISFTNDETERYVTSFGFELVYDEGTLQTYSFEDNKGNAIGPFVNELGGLDEKNFSTPGRAIVAGTKTDGVKWTASANEVLAYILFEVKQDAESGDITFHIDKDYNNQVSYKLTSSEVDVTKITDFNYDAIAASAKITGNTPKLDYITITPTEGDAEAYYDEEKTYTLKALSDKGKDITDCVTWSVTLYGDSAISGYTLKDNTLKVTNAKVGTYTVTATPKEGLCTGSATGTFTVVPQKILNLTLELTGYGKGLNIADATITGNDGVTVGHPTWYEVESGKEASGSFKAATAYKVAVTLTLDDNHKFEVGAKAKLERKEADITNIKEADIEDNTAVFILDPTENKDTPAVQPPENLSATYGQKLSEVSVAGFKATFGDDGAEVAGNFHWKDDTQSVGDVGDQEHTIVFTPEDTENYATTSTQVSVEVTPADIRGAEIGNIDVQEYTGKEITPAPEVKLGDVVLKKDVDYDLTYSDNTAITDNATVIVTGKGNYTGKIEKTFRIVKSLSSEDITIEVPNDAFEYSGSEFKPEATVKDGDKLLVKDTDYVVSYSDNTNAGTATVKVTGTGSYTGTKTANFTISPKPLTVTFDPITKPYDGNTDVTLEGLKLTGKLANDDVGVVAPWAAAFASQYVGKHSITFAGDFGLSGDAAGNYTLTQPEGITGTITPDKRTLTSSATSEDSPEKLTKGGKTLDLTTLVESNTTPVKTGITFTCETLYGCTLENGILTSGNTINETLAITVKGAEVDLNGDKTPEYTAANDITIYVQIVDKQDAGLTVDGITDEMSMTYGDEKTLTWSVADAAKGGEITFKSSEAKVIRAEGSKISAVGVGTATITATYDSPEYYGQKTFTVTVNKKPITVTAKNETMVYGDPLPEEFTYTVTAGSLVAGDELDIGAETDATKTSSVGDYTITLTAAENANPNYDVTMLPGKLTITKAPLTITNAAVQDKTYDGLNTATVTGVTFSGMKNGDVLVKDTDYTASGEFKDANAGAEKEVSVTVTLNTTGKAANYELKPNTFTATAKITKRVTELTLTANDAVYTGKPYDLSNITVGSTAATFKFFANVDGVAANEITRPTDVGTYWVIATVEESQNEAKSEKNAKFMITPKELSAGMVEAIPDQSYTGEQITPAVTIKYNGMTLQAGKDYTVAYTDNTNVGETAKATITGKGNYFGELTKNFTITAKPVTGAEVAFSKETLTYNGAAQHPATITVKVGNVTLEAGKDYTVAYLDEANAGEHTATISFKGNYSGSVTAKYTIEKLTAEIAWSPAATNFLYTGSACEVTASVSNKALDTDEVTVTVKGGKQTEIGSYTATATALDNPNYQLPASGLTCRFTIKNAIESIRVEGQNTVTATVDGLTIKLTGTMKEDEPLELTINDVNYTVTSADVVNVSVGDDASITYKLDKTGLTETPTNVDLTETKPAVETASTADEATVKAADEISKNGGAQSEGLAAAAAEAVTKEAASKADGDAKITAETKLEIQVVRYEKQTADNKSVLTLEITPKVTYKDADNAEIETKEIPNSAIKAPVTISIKLPEDMPTKDLFVKHELKNGGVEYLKVTVDEETRVATWQQSSFSPVVLMADSRTVTIKLVKDDEGVIDMELDLSSIGTALPKDGSKSKWKFDGITGSYDTITKELFDELAKKTGTVTANSVSGSSSDPDPKPTKPGSSSSGLLLPSLGDDELSFRDVSKYDYYYNAVKWAVKKGVTSGTGRYTFSPDDACTRAQTVTFLWRAAGCPQASTKANPFTDVATSDYFYEAVLWAVENGITNGTSKTTFSPNASVTRAQVATFLWRANGEPAARDSGFADVAANAYYAKAVAWAYAEGITTGTGFGVFSPEAICTRAQIVTFLFRNAK